MVFIPSGNPQQHAYIERVNRSVRYNWLSHYIDEDFKQLQDGITRWLWIFNNERLNMAIDGITLILTKNLNSTTALH